MNTERLHLGARSYAARALFAVTLALLGVVFASCAEWRKITKEITALKQGNRAWLHMAEFHPEGLAILFTNQLGLAVGIAEPKGKPFTGSWIRAIEPSPELNAEFSIVSGRFVAGAALGFPLSVGLKTNVSVHICLGQQGEMSSASVHLNIIVSNYNTGTDSVLEYVDLNCDSEWDVKATNSSRVLRVGDRWLPVIGRSRKGYFCLEDGQTNLFRWNGRYFEPAQDEEGMPEATAGSQGLLGHGKPSSHASNSGR